MYLAEELQTKWDPIINHKDLTPIADPYRRKVMGQLLENAERDLNTASGQNGSLLSEASPIHGNQTGSAIDNFDPVMISLIRRTMPNLMAYDIMGVQPMTGPTGLIFAMRTRYANNAGTEAFYNEANTAFSTVVAGANTMGDKHTGTVPAAANNAANGAYNFAAGMSTAQSEALGTDSNTAFAEMAFEIEKVTVTAKARALKAEWTMELAQDLKTVHGLDAETELSNILSSEILAEINREAVRTIYVTAKQGASENTTTAGVFDLDVDANGRWMVEKFKGLHMQVEREANKIAKETRRGRGNVIICSSDVASALQMAGVLDYTPALNNTLNIDDTGNTFVGILNKKYKVYIDPYVTGGNYFVVGYKGSSAYDAGLFYCPYVPLQQVRAIDPNSFAPKIGFKTRYGMVANPFAEGTTQGAGALTKDSNVYYRRVIVNNVM